jgi:phosphoribosyl 1,2-cyclic phosphodiesterase
MVVKLTFLGTGGGRFATIYQVRSTGGIYFEEQTKNLRIHIDPGPGAAVRLRDEQLDPTNTDGIIITHCHPDHYTDAEILIEGMTRGGTIKRGVVLGSRTVVEGIMGYGPALSSYHRALPKSLKVIQPQKTYSIKGLTLRITKLKHSDPSTVGLKFYTNHGIVSYIPDTELTPELIRAYKRVRLMILACTIPLQTRIPYHLCTEDIAEIVKLTKPELAVITHFGLRVIREDPDIQARWIMTEAGIRTIAAYDGMKIELNDTIKVY